MSPALLPQLVLDRLRAVAAEASDARLVVLFGSVARDQAMTTSDVDLGISGLGFWDSLRLGAELGSVLGREPHVVDLDQTSDVLRFHVARDGILLHEGAPHAWTRFRAEALVRYLDFAPILSLCAEGVRRRLLREAGRG
ncbi:MAG: nucleotidyltransferase domain-containing protein [Deltaproteobacteria bacterium]|nr:nucleotidyltransferase domain-containing protein [Deltaproteobacteria bacterium]